MTMMLRFVAGGCCFVAGGLAVLGSWLPAAFFLVAAAVAFARLDGALPRQLAQDPADDSSDRLHRQ